MNIFRKAFHTPTNNDGIAKITSWLLRGVNENSTYGSSHTTASAATTTVSRLAPVLQDGTIMSIGVVCAAKPQTAGTTTGESITYDILVTPSNAGSPGAAASILTSTFTLNAANWVQGSIELKGLITAGKEVLRAGDIVSVSRTYVNSDRGTGTTGTPPNNTTTYDSVVIDVATAKNFIN